MVFDLEIWKRETSQKLRQIGKWLDRRRWEDAPYVLYGALCGATIWPLVEAAQQGQLLPVAMALGGVASGIGGNLIAEQIQRWKDRAEGVDEAQVTQWVIQHVDNPEVRAALDAILEKLDAIPQAQAALSEDDRQWFAETLRNELDRLGNRSRFEAVLIGSGAIAQQGGVAAGAGGIAIGGSVEGGVHVTQVVAAPGSKPLPLPEALRRYLDNLIDTHQHLRLQGIRAGGQPISVDLEKVYVSLTAIEKRTSTAAASEKARESDAEFARAGSQFLTIDATLNRYPRLVIIGDPGSGKTTLLTYLALTYARDLRDGTSLVRERLRLGEKQYLPILLPLRDFGHHLKDKHPNPASDGPALLLDYLREYYAAQSIPLPEDFFAQALEEKRAVVLLDGMDEVAETKLRQRVARIVEKFAVRYPGNRFVVTSREVGYEGASRIGADFGLAKVREFSLDDVRHFVRDWTRVVEVKLAGRESPDILRLADEQAERLSRAIEGNPRIIDLAVNPLLLTVIALVHRYRAQLPERRSELYEEAVEVLLARWDEAKGMDVATPIAGRELDAGDRRALLEPAALWLHEQKRREIELDELRPLLLPSFKTIAEGDAQAAGKAADAFLRVINERSGLLIERGAGIYGFAHLTFQEYLAARAVADREDALAYTLERLADPWWREVILLEAGYLSTQGKRRLSELIRAIMDADPKTEPEPYHHLILAAECLYDVGAARIEGDLLSEAKRRLKNEVDKPLKKGNRELILRRVAAANALSMIESGQFASAFWKAPWGEPDWMTVPAGEFWMGSEEYDHEKPVQKVTVQAFQISRVPITNAQYAIFVEDAKVKPPEDWRGNQPPKGKENHPVVNVSWRDAQAYCRWLSEKIDKPVRLPTEAEWEKAAQGDRDKRRYPWGDEWEDLKCCSHELGLDDTSPVGLFRAGASPYGCLDMSGNVWEWTRSVWGKDWNTPFKYPYDPDDRKREDLEASDDSPRVMRGGAFSSDARDVRCAVRDWGVPDFWFGPFGFRVVVASPF